jgi:hypothetical protein
MLLKTANKAVPLPDKDTGIYRQYRTVHLVVPHFNALTAWLPISTASVKWR